MAKETLSSSGICAIIEACAKNGVSSLAFEGLRVQFSCVPYLEQSSVGGLPPIEHNPVAVPLSDEAKELLEDARMAQLMTDDPLAYEQEMIDALKENSSGEAEDPG